MFVQTHLLTIVIDNQTKSVLPNVTTDYLKTHALGFKATP